jgi:hypothetical protein
MVAPRASPEAIRWSRTDSSSPLEIEYVRTYYINMPKPSQRDRILDAGLKVMFRKGYVGAGVRDIVAEAPAPQGFVHQPLSRETDSEESGAQMASIPPWLGHGGGRLPAANWRTLPQAV